MDPISIILVKSDSKGNKLLFRYPYEELGEQGQRVKTKSRNNNSSPYALPPSTEDNQQNNSPGQLMFSDDVLSTLFAVKTELCNRKFELKVNDVRFVSHPTLIGGTSKSNLITIVFALHAQSSYSIVKQYYELSRRLGYALFYEENRTGYLTDEMKIMLKAHDEIANEDENKHQKLSRFDLVLERTTLAQHLKTVYYDLCATGLINLTINQGVSLSFCLHQKAHQFHKKGLVVEPEAIDLCLQSLKPYHGMLLLVDPSELLDCVPPSGAKMLIQLIEIYNPLKSIQYMASDADLQLTHVYQLVGHLVFWAKATIIYPLCETNVYVISPDAPLHINSPLVEKFAKEFPGMSLFEVISDFSLPTSIGHLTTPLQHPARQGRLAQMVLWMLQHHLLMQLHTYVQFLPADDICSMSSTVSRPIEADEYTFETSVQNSYDDHTRPESLSISSPVPVPNPSRRSDSTIFENTEMNTLSPSHKSNCSTQSVVSLSTDNSLASVEDEEKIKELLQAFDEPERSAVRRIPASSNTEDLTLMVKLLMLGYFKGEHHLEEIMYFENLRRSQLLQLLDKFRDVLIIYETEDPAISSLYTQT